MKFKSYSQNFEDVLLWRGLQDIANGRYIDIGAQHPTIDSVSKGFYELGWRGIHVEPTTEYSSLLRIERHDEITVSKAVSSSTEKIILYETPGTGLSTTKQSIAERNSSIGYSSTPISVETITLAEIFDLANSFDEIHWLKIDVEGMEGDVLKSWGDHTARPWIVCVESTLPLTTTDTGDQWHSELETRGYEYVHFDGLNRFYVRRDKTLQINRLKVPPNVFDEFELAPTHRLCIQSHQIANQLSHELENSKQLLHLSYKRSREQMHAAAQQLARLNLSMHKLQQDAHAASNENKANLASVLKLTEELNFCKNKIDEITSSSSWRITALPRWVFFQARLARKHGLMSRFRSAIRKIFRL
jgi:FkbM family methyltransferase